HHGSARFSQSCGVYETDRIHRPRSGEYGRAGIANAQRSGRLSSSPIVVAEDVVMAYPDGAGGALVAVEAASFTVARAEKFVIIGPSGCGKTTLLKAIAGFMNPAAGS